MKNLTKEQEEYINDFSIECLLGGFWWALFNELWIYAFALLIPVINIFVWAYLSVKGRRISFRNKEWLSFAQFKDRQAIALIIGIVNIVLVIIGIAMFFLFLHFVLNVLGVTFETLQYLLFNI